MTKLALVLEDFTSKLNNLKSKSEFLISKIDPEFSKECDECKEIIEDIDILSERIKTDVIKSIDKRTKQLKESEKRYRHLFEQSPNKIVLIDYDGTFISVNSPFLNYFGYKREELVGKKFTEIESISPENVLLFRKIFKEAVSKGIFEPIEFRAYNKYNDEKWMELRASSIEIDDIKMVQVILQDIDERKSAEEALKSERDKLQAIIDGLTSAGLGIDIIGDDYKVHYMNKILKERFGDNIGKVCYENYMESKEPCEICPVMKSIKSNTVEHVELTAADNRNYELFSAPIPNPDGTISKSIELIIDITERKKTEQNLKESEEKFRTIAEQSLMGIVILQNDLFKYVNQQYADIFGYEVNEMMNWEAGEFNNLVHPEDREFVMEQARKKQRGLADVVPHYQFRGIKKTGESIWIEVLSNTISYEGGSADLIKIIDITEKKKAEEKIIKEREKADLYLNLVEVIIVALDRVGNVILLNKKGYDILEYEEGELIGKNWFKTCLPPKDRNSVLEYFKKLMTGEIDVIPFYENPVYTKNGNERLIAWSTILIKDNDGNITGLLSSGQDITERKKAELELIESENRYKYLAKELEMILDHIPGIVVYKDTENNILRVNKFLADAHNLTKKDMEGISSFDIYPKDQAQAYWEDDLEVVNSKQPKLNIIEPWETKIGSRWVNTSKIPYIDEYGNVKGIIAIANDITETKLAEEKLKASEEKYRHLFNSSPNAIVLTNKEGIIIDCNLATEKTFSYSKEEFIGKYYIDLGIFSPDQISYFVKAYKKLRQGIDIKPFELKIRKKDGSLIWVNFQSFMVILDGQILVQSIAQDITEKKKAEEMINEEIKKLKELDQIKSEFIDRASHELKTPLNSIYGASTFLLDYYKDFLDDKAKELLEIIKKGGERLIQLIEDLLDVSRLESGELDLKMQGENIVKIIYECVNDLNYFAERRKIKFNLEIQEDFYLEVDKIRFEQVIVNLISNAIKNTLPNGDIHINLQKHEASVDIIIKDTGVGFTEEEKEKVFKKFGKIERYGKGMDIDTEGSGLGLYISKRIVELHNGKIWIESKGRNQGSKVIVKLPISGDSSILY